MKLPCFVAKQKDGTWKCAICGAFSRDALDAINRCPRAPKKAAA